MSDYIDLLPLIGVTSFAFSSLCLNHIFQSSHLRFLEYNPDPVYASWYVMSSFDSGSIDESKYKNQLLTKQQCKAIFNQVYSMELRPMLMAYTGLLPNNEKTIQLIKKRFNIENEKKLILPDNG